MTPQEEIEICLNCVVKPDCVGGSEKYHPNCPFTKKYAGKYKISSKFDSIAKKNGFKDTIAAVAYLYGITSAENICKLFGCSHSTIYRWIDLARAEDRLM